MDDSVPMIVLLIPHIVLARTTKEHSLLAIIMTLKHVMVVAVVVFSGHIIPQLVSIWYCREGHRLATGPQVNVVMFGRTSERWM